MQFQQRFGLPVQVLWSDNGTWRETKGMDDLTLMEFNDLGRNSSDAFIVSDYEEGFEEVAE
jgi:hypothetical protein